MHACDICQYLNCQNVFCTISPNITLANISPYMVYSKIKLTRGLLAAAQTNVNKLKAIRKLFLTQGNVFSVG